jgi:hypothetical protein
MLCDEQGVQGQASREPYGNAQGVHGGLREFEGTNQGRETHRDDITNLIWRGSTWGLVQAHNDMRITTCL